MANVALVTGASRGIGAAIAARLAADGYYVLGTATREAGAQAIDNRLGAQGRGLLFDASQPCAVEALMAAVQADPTAQGHLHIVVNNAGMTRDGLLLRATDDDLMQVLQVNLLSAMQLSRAALKPMMRARAGRIVNISSVVGQMGNAGQSAYIAAKAGLEGFTRALAREMGGRSITVNAVAPGFIQTDMTDQLTQAQRDAMRQQIALGRLGTVQDVAAAVAFLVSPDASYVTGAVLPVNGGLYMS